MRQQVLPGLLTCLILKRHGAYFSNAVRDSYGNPLRKGDFEFLQVDEALLIIAEDYYGPSLRIHELQ